MSKIVKTSLEINDWFEFVDDKIDLWITDPPYPFENQNGTNRFNFDSSIQSDTMYSRMSWHDIRSCTEKMFDISNDGSRLYMFSSRDGLGPMLEIIDNSGWKFRNILVWDKKNMGMGYHWRNQIEYIIYASKGKPKSYVKSSSNLFSYKKPRGLGQSAKPVEIWSEILKNSSVDNDVCADPFAGHDPMSSSLENNKSIMGKIKKSYSNSY